MSTLLILLPITLLAVISPGPDFIVVMKNALRSRASGYAATLGIALAIFIHVGYCIAGVGFVISQSIILFSVIKVIGALYLLYLAWQLVRSKPSKEQVEIQKDSVTSNLFASFKEGFLANALNPKATLFFLAVYSQVVAPDTAILTQIGYGAFMSMIAASWFCFLSWSVNIPKVRKNISRFEHRVNQALGVVLGMVGIKILTGSH